MVINKGLTGCGATTLAIDQDRDTLITVPYISLINNKTSQKEHKDVLLGLHGTTKDGFRSAIQDYLAIHSRIKIMMTYDALPIVCATLSALGYDPYNTMHLVIDEWHLLFSHMDFRGDATKGVLREAPKFKMVTYLSATPIEKEY